ncbi:HAMP domain-containing sensor histidine kinase [uncultured Clostridium sp.]|uniref:sensor histidine kinase n=1 Tax=uncultured Clostridium sp. TaxID=59620 RepID=UPI002609AECB|nr:HAMP domain-containing sensor histidine kinase [uncultured Clostridium sp.]
MQILIIVCLFVIGILLVYIYKIKKELKSIVKQLDEYNTLNVEKKIDVSLFNKEIEDLAEKINENIDISKKIRIKEIENKNNLKNMISNISHDLRTPLTSIKGYIQILKKGNVTKEKEKEYLEKIEKRAGDLQEMLEEFFYLSIIEEDKYELNLETIDIKEVLCETLISYYDQFERINIEPKINIKGNYTIIGDKKEIKRIIENLLNNVIKHSNGDIEITLEKDEEICLSVSNLIEEDIDINRLFDKFYKGNDKNRKEKNTGLGLSIAKSLIEKMNGSIDAKIINKKLYIICRWKEYK